MSAAQPADRSGPTVGDLLQPARSRRDKATGRRVLRYPPAFKRFLIETFGLGLVAFGFATVVLSPWYTKWSGVPFVLLGKDIFQHPTRRDHLRVWWRRRA